MPLLRTLLPSVAFAAVLLAVFAQNISLQSAPDLQAGNNAQRSTDARFLSSIDENFSGNRKMAAEHISSRGWQFLRRGNTIDAVQRFKQALTLDAENGNALWGMATAQANLGRFSESLQFFDQAERIVPDNVDFSADYARALGFAGARTGNHALLREAFARFERLHQRAPQHTFNLENWAKTLFQVGDYAEARRKLKLAENTPHRDELDPSFFVVLESKIKRQ